MVDNSCCRYKTGYTVGLNNQAVIKTTHQDSIIIFLDSMQLKTVSNYYTTWVLGSNQMWN